MRLREEKRLRLFRTCHINHRHLTRPPPDARPLFVRCSKNSLSCVSSSVEAAKWKHEQSGDSSPFYDPFKGWPKTENEQEKMKMRELKNGRAAMLCWASFMSAALIPGSVPDFCIPF